MGKPLNVPGGTEVELLVEGPDDGAGILLENTKVVHVNMGETKGTTVRIGPGERREVRFELWNLTGGAYHAVFRAVANDKEIYHADPHGQGPPNPLAWWAEIDLIGKR